MMEAITLVLVCILMGGCTDESAATPEQEKEASMFSNAEKTYVIFSPIEGVLMNGNQPLPNIIITRRLRWNGNEDGRIETFTTDDQGRFSLPLHEEKLALGMLDQFVAKVELKINGDDVIWYGNKMFPELYAETDGPVENLVCDIASEEIPVYMRNSLVPSILTKCRWKNMPKS